MKLRTMIPIAACLAALAAAAPAFGEPEIRHEQVQFQKGTTGATVKGGIRGRQVIDYRVRAVAGQNMDVTLKASRTSAYFNVLATDDVPLFVGSVSGNQFSGLLPKDGDYTIRVYLAGNAASSNQSADFTLDIDITSRPASAVRGSTPPAKYDASGKIKCSEDKETLERQCDFRVVRHSATRSAQIWIAYGPDGRTRVLHYADRKFTTDDGARISAQRQNDSWRVGIGGREFYLIPDALIHGG